MHRVLSYIFLDVQAIVTTTKRFYSRVLEVRMVGVFLDGKKKSEMNLKIK